MKATGIVRRLDDLGRLVIPKEMRRQYQLREGDSIEFFTEEDRIIIEKHNVFSRYMEEIELMCDILKKTYGHTVLFLHAEWLHKHQVKVSESFIRHAGVHRTVRLVMKRSMRAAICARRAPFFRSRYLATGTGRLSSSKGRSRW